eukprot:6999582-Prymnesium_polylepis.1
MHLGYRVVCGSRRRLKGREGRKPLSLRLVAIWWAMDGPGVLSGSRGARLSITVRWGVPVEFT